MSVCKEMHFQVLPNTFRLDGWITQRIRQQVPDRRTGDWESPQTVPNVQRQNHGIFILLLNLAIFFIANEARLIAYLCRYDQCGCHYANWATNIDCCNWPLTQHQEMQDTLSPVEVESFWVGSFFVGTSTNHLRRFSITNRRLLSWRATHTTQFIMMS